MDSAPILPAGYSVHNPPQDPFGFKSQERHESIILDLSYDYSLRKYKCLIDTVIERHQALPKAEFQNVILFENHTKDLQTDAKFRKIKKLIEYILIKYPFCKFVTLGQFIKTNEDLCKAKNLSTELLDAPWRYQERAR